MARHGENIYKRKDGRYEGRYIIGYNAEGKAKYHAVYAKTYHEVKQKMNTAKYSGFHEVTPSAVTVTQWFYIYLDRVNCNIKITTYSVYRRYIDNHIEPYFKNTKLYKLSREKLQMFIDSLTESGLSARTVQSIFVFISNGLKSAYDDMLIDRIWDKIRRPKPKSRQMRVFCIDEQRRIENAIDNSENKNYIGVFICLYTGLRIGEVCGLMWEDIDFRNSLLNVRRTLQRVQNFDNDFKKTKITVLPPKSEASYRIIPLPEFVIKRLIEHKKAHSSNGGYVLHNSGNPIDPRTYQYQFKQLLKVAGVEKANFHTTRHTFATRALEKGFDVKTLSEILGHSSAVITLNKYSHSLDEHKRSRMELLSSIF